MEDYGYKDIHKLMQFVTTSNFRRVFLKDLKAKHVKVPTFCPFLTANFHENKKNQNLKMEIKFESEGTISPFEKVTSFDSYKNILEVLQLLPENYLHTQKTQK